MRFAAPLALFALFGCVPVASAGIFSPHESCPFEIAPDGIAKPLPLNVFKLLLNERVAALNPIAPEIQPGTADTLTFKGVVVRRVNAASKSPNRAEMVGLSADRLRLGHNREVIELLTPTIRDDNPDYRLLMHLAMAHAALGDWDLALKRGGDARDCDPPTELAGTKPEQLQWMLKVDRAYSRPWMTASRANADPKSRPIDPDVPQLFGGTLPPDAIGIVQQMVLWAPLDANLLWLLGSLYLEKGHFAEAYDMLEQGRERKLTWPKFRAQHAAAEAGYAKLPKVDLFGSVDPPVDAVPEPKPRGLFALVAPEQFAVVAGGFALAVFALIALQIRKVRRRKRRRAI